MDNNEIFIVKEMGNISPSQSRKSGVPLQKHFYL